MSQLDVCGSSLVFFLVNLTRFGRTNADSSHVAEQPTYECVPRALCTLNSAQCLEFQPNQRLQSGLGHFASSMHHTSQSSNQGPSCVFDFRVDLHSRFLTCPHRLVSIMGPTLTSSQTSDQREFGRIASVKWGISLMTPWMVLFV